MINFKCATQYCKDDLSLIENYKQAFEDTTQTWECHHRLETELNVSAQYLKDNNLYLNRPASELIFLTKFEHVKLHGENISEETRKKISETSKGRKCSEETRKKLSEAQKGRKLSEETKKKLSEALKGKIPWIKGRKLSEETRKKMSEAAKRRHIKKYKADPTSD